MENKKYTLLDLFKNNMKVYVLTFGGDESLYRYNNKNNKIEYFSSRGKIWKETLNAFGWLSRQYFTEYIEPTYTIDDLMCNQGKVYELEDEPVLYTVDDGILYFYAIDGQWLESEMVYNDVMKQKFVEYTGGIKYEN